MLAPFAADREAVVRLSTPHGIPSAIAALGPIAYAGGLQVNSHLDTCGEPNAIRVRMPLRPVSQPHLRYQPRGIAP